MTTLSIAAYRRNRLPLAPLSLAATVVLILAVWSGPARAQRLPTATSPGAYVTLGGTYSGFKAQYPQVTIVGAGGFLDMNFRRQIGVELEGRSLERRQVSGAHQITYLVGPRIEAHRGIFAPYVKGLVGNGHLTFPYGYGYGNYLVLAPGGGLDVRVTEKIKLRVIDFEYQVWPQFSLGEISPYGISAGISYEIYDPSGWRRGHIR